MSKAGPNYGGVLRAAAVGLAVILQLLTLALFIVTLKQYAVYAYVLLELFGTIEVFAIVGRNRNSSYTIAWLLVIMLLPVFGNVLYVLWGRSGTHSRKSKAIAGIWADTGRWLAQNDRTFSRQQRQYPQHRRLSSFLQKEGFPLYEHTACDYLPLGELQFERMIEDMENARRFIFLEYFIVAKGALWERIHGVLKRKAEEGVVIRFLYDDLGSILTLPEHFHPGIEVRRFNPVHRHLSRLYLNYRNHQKIVVIDGDIAYTGGTNLADEYANLYEKHGHWKDTAIRLRGEAVWSLTVTFLQMWQAESGREEDYSQYRPRTEVEGEGYFQPFYDGPVNHPSDPAQSCYLQMIAAAQDYVYITTPYLVVDEVMMEALCMAARSGVDVRIITPKVWDHWYVHMVTRSNYGKLLKAGVRIYEYTPGYIHAKTILSDDTNAVTGSINMDYRSFYLHFENGVWICGSPALLEMKKDILKIFSVSEEILYAQWKERPWHIRASQAFLRLFTPLM